MNWFMLAQAVLSAGAAMWEIHRENWHMAVVYAAWTVSNLALAYMGAAK